ncbi:MAG: EthD family reductase [Gammaproteobacteria bacterium]
MSPNTKRRSEYSPSTTVSRRRVIGGAGAFAAIAALPYVVADAAQEVSVGMRAYTAIFPGGDGIEFDHEYYRDQHLAAMQRLYGAALARVEMRKPVVAAGDPTSRYAAIVNFWIPDPELFAKASAAHGQTLVQDKARFTNSEQKVQSEEVFGEVGKPASAIRAGDRCLTVLYPLDPAARFDYEYYRDHHMASLIELFGAEAISRMEIRKALTSADGRNPPLYACTANIYVGDSQLFAAAASRNHQRIVDDIPRFSSVGPISVMTEVLGAFDA